MDARPAVFIGFDAAHRVMLAGLHRDWVLERVDTLGVLGEVKYILETVPDTLLATVAHIEVYVPIVDTPPLVYFREFCPGNHIAGYEFASVVGVSPPNMNRSPSEL